MANPRETIDSMTSVVEQARLTEFRIKGLFGEDKEIVIQFPTPSDSQSTPSILILSGRNGTGKTTILRMIAGILRLDFDEFRRIPFSKALLSFSTGDSVGVHRNEDSPLFPITASFRNHSVKLAADKEKQEYEREHFSKIKAFREQALPIVRSVNFVLLDVNRGPEFARYRDNSMLDPTLRRLVQRDRGRSLADQVKLFLREAQVDYRRFFRGEELDLLPRILERLNSESQEVNTTTLRARVQDIRSQHPTMRRYGLQTEEDELTTLDDILTNKKYRAQTQLSLIQTYVEIQENIQNRRDLIAKRLIEFEDIMDDFLVGKRIRIDPEKGLSIQTTNGPLEEDDLSSGEYHFLYMMVSALLCRRLGSVIAIDEPELSLHVTWQRKLVSALARCAAGASPLFLFATHSLSIQAEHADRVVKLGPVD